MQNDLYILQLALLTVVGNNVKKRKREKEKKEEKKGWGVWDVGGVGCSKC